MITEIILSLITEKLGMLVHSKSGVSVIKPTIQNIQMVVTTSPQSINLEIKTEQIFQPVLANGSPHCPVRNAMCVLANMTLSHLLTD